MSRPWSANRQFSEALGFKGRIAGRNVRRLGGAHKLAAMDQDAFEVLMPYAKGERIQVAELRRECRACFRNADADFCAWCTAKIRATEEEWTARRKALTPAS